MQFSAIPLKWTLPFAANDSAKVEIPATTSDPTRFSLSLGSPPLTGQPPETGGVPPQLEDFNGAMNQVSRVGWWAMAGGPWPYDATFAADPNVSGYPRGAQLPSADLLGEWVSTVDNNTSNPDTVGTGWVPGFAYGTTALTGQAGGTVTLTPAQAAKRALNVAGTLTSNLTIILPTWLQDWTVTNTTTGAFTVTVKTASGSGVLIPQNSLPTPVAGDGTNITQLTRNIAPGTSATSAAQVSQLIGTIGSARKLFMSVTAASATGTMTADEIVVGDALSGGRLYLLSAFNKTLNLATTGAGGMDTGAAPATGYVAIYAIYNPTTQTAALLGVNATSVLAPTIYGGANLPAGYTASGLVAVWPTNASSQFVIGQQTDRQFSGPLRQALLTTTQQASPTSFSIAAAAPLNARFVGGAISLQNNTANTGNNAVLSADASQSSYSPAFAYVASAGGAGALPYANFAMITAQTMFYTLNTSGGTTQLTVYVTNYTI